MENKKTVWDDSFSRIDPRKIPLPSDLSNDVLGVFRENVKKGSHILEAGSGTGEISGWLSKNGYKTTLLDISDIAINLSKDFFRINNIKGEFVRGDIFEMPYPDNAFDCVWNSGVMEHFDEKGILKGLSEMARVSADKVIVLVPNARAIFYRLAKWELEKNDKWAAGSEFPKYSLEKYFKKSGLSLVSESVVSLELGIEWSKHIDGNLNLAKITKEFLASHKKEAKYLLSEIGYLLVAVGTKNKNRSNMGSREKYLDDNEISIDEIISLGRVREDILKEKYDNLASKIEKYREVEEFLRYELNKKNHVITKTGANKIYRVLTTIKHPGSLKKYLDERKRYKEFDEKTEKRIIRLEKRLKPPKKIKEIIAQNRKCVSIVSSTFLYKDGSRPYLGGAERYLLDLSKLITSFGYRTRIFQLSTGPYWFKQFNKDVEVIGVPTEDTDVLSDFAINYTPEENLIIFSPFTLAIKPRKNSIGISHGVFWDSEQAQEGRVQYNDFYEKIIDSITNSGTLVSVDTNTINSVRSTHNKIASKFEYIPNYVNTAIFKPTKRKDERIRIIYPRRLYWPRGFYLLVNILDRIFSINSLVEVVFVGQADPNEEELVNGLVSKFGNKIKWESYNPDEMVEAYQKADITLIPTIASEGTSLSCLEAMACGNAVIATNVGGLPDLILDGFNGILISPNEDDLFEALEKLVLNKKLRNTLSANAVKVAENFNIKKWNNEWKGILSSYLR